MINRSLFIVIAVSIAVVLTISCSGGVVRSLFEKNREGTVLQLQNLSLPALPSTGGIYQLWCAIGDQRISFIRFVVVGSSLWPEEYLDYDPADLPATLKSYGTLSNTEMEISLPEGKTRSDIDALYLTIEPVEDDDGVMSASILLAGKLNVRGRANMALDPQNDYGGLPDVFDGSGYLMLATPTNSSTTSALSRDPKSESWTEDRKAAEDGDTTPPVWTGEQGIISAAYNSDDSEVSITFGSAGDADSPPVSYVLYWQSGTSIDFEDNTVLANSILLDITGQDTAPYSATFTSDDISGIGSVLSLAVHARDSAVPQNETAPVDPHPTHDGGKDWLTISPANPWYKGIWFVYIPDGASALEASLTLPDLTDVAGWTYEAWAYNTTDQTLLSLGRFDNPKAADSDAGGVQAGAGTAYTAPGSDYLSSDYDFRQTGWQFFITVEPNPDTESAGFVWRLLTANAKTDMLETEALPLTAYSGSQPFGVARIL